jgi:predicted nucleic acid-binding Zn finger protein
MARPSYNPGTPTRPVKIAPARYSVDSFRGEEKSYEANLRTGSCTCPHFTGRLAGTGEECKHLKAARAQEWEEIVAKAGRVPSAELPALLAKYEAAGRFDIALAIRAEILDREQAGTREADLKRLFA